MTITVGGTSITFNDSTTQSTAGITSAVTSAVAGNGVAVSASTGAVTFSVSAPSNLSVGSYSLVASNNGSYQSITIGSSIPSPINTAYNNANGVGNSLSGTWIVMSGAMAGPFICGTRQNMYLAVRSA